MPQDVNTLIVTWKYDIYDKNPKKDSDGNLIYNLVRKDSEATNTLPLSKVINGFTALERGKKYSIRLTVKPTYLYVMSDDDLNNPGLE